ncbi:MAG: 4Fe-4S dicluster domain-containing protein [Spirochaetota bacterium]|nr:MAG: 4Fe-4S dicluster domain-containing protein [Spirochaetota bacterium]
MNAKKIGSIYPDFKNEVSRCPGGENIMRCFACGTCVLSCPVSEVTAEYSPRRIIHMILLGMKEEVLGSDAIWYCVKCYRCHVMCPQEVKYPEIIRVLRKMALEQGYVKPLFVNAINEIDRITQDMRCTMLEQIIVRRDSITENDMKEISKFSEKLDY